MGIRQGRIRIRSMRREEGKMSHRAQAAAIAVIAGVALMPMFAAAQATDATGPRTPWGHPDLQGTWDYRTLTPLERPVELGDKAFLTEEEAATLEQETLARNELLLNRARPADDGQRPGRPACGRHPRLLQQLLAGSGHHGHCDAPHLADRRARQRAPAGVDRAGAAARQLPRGGAPRGRAARAAARRQLRGSGRGRPLHPAREGRPAAEHRRLQQQHDAVPDARPRGDSGRAELRRAHHPARRAVPRVAAVAAVDGRFARLLGGRHARCRDGQLQREARPDRAAAAEQRREPVARRAVHADGWGRT